ncbi:hypothetical protein Vretifemale_202 [Volvox reticuliferus]|uniref:GCN5-related N-acetyltransferase Rv2170-like domain-containing protein n=1 Tax=Volvox reticuliferus TaxID=1737510 RepID=A0A8J4FCH7_9CHLO|nr:hypothetical protein Vretifemale_202 [Volvox reticuliferus]
MAAQILVVYSIWPGRSSYSVFVEDCPAAAPGDSSSGRVTVQPPSRRQRGAVSDRPSTCGHLAQPGKRSGAEVPPTTNHPCNHQQGDHRNHLFVAALRGILALPPPHGPGRLAFSAIPGYWIRELPGENWGVGGERGSRRVEVQPPGPDCAESGKRKGCEHTYVLDELRSEADACLVNSLWTYRSPYSLPLVRILVAHRHTACVRLQKNDDDDDGPAGPVGPATDTPPPAGAAGDTRGDGFGSESASAEVGSTSDAVAWILQYPDGSIGMAHTLPPHRRRGLMKRCVREVAERVLGWKRQGGSGGSRSASSEVFTYIVEGNTASIALFEGLGFQRSAERYHWFGAEGVEPAEGGLVVEGQGQQTVRP